MTLLAGCSESVQGQPVRATRSESEQALPTSSELSQVLGIQLQSDSAVRAGSADVLRDSANTVPLECVGVAHSGDRQTYKDARLHDAAQSSWITPGDRTQTRVLISVVEFDSPQDASAWYAETAANWRRCQGVSVTQRTDAFTFTDSIHRVGEAAGVTSAELLLATADGLMTPTPHGRALTVVSRYAADVEVLGDFDQEGSDNLHVDAAAIARLVAIKVTSAR